jgi:hypothetical protein
MRGLRPRAATYPGEEPFHPDFGAEPRYLLKWRSKPRDDGSLPTRRPARAQIQRKQPKQPDLPWIVSYWGRTPAKDLPGIIYAPDEEAAK